MRRPIVVMAAVALVATATLVPGAGAPIGAQAGLSMEVTPTTGVPDSGEVVVEVDGLPTAAGTVVEFRLCDEPVASGATAEELGHCFPLIRSHTDGQATYTATIGLPETYTVYLPPDWRAEFHSCSDEPFDCSLVAFVVVPDGEPVGEVASVPVDFDPTPLRVDGALGGAGPAQVAMAFEPGTTVTLAQCVDFVGAPRDLPNCVAGPTVTLPDGRDAAEFALAPSVEAGGAAYDCTRRPCQVVAFDPAGTELATARIPGSVPSARITLERTTAIPPGSTVHATVESDAPTFVGQCVASVLQGTISVVDGCALVASASPGTTEHDIQLRDRFPSYSGTTTLVCADDPGGCIVGTGDDSGATSWYVPISFGPPQALTVAPDSDLVDGQEMTVSATGLFPGRAYVVRRCSQPYTDGNCDTASGDIVASADGRLTATVTAAQRLDTERRTYCRANCVVTVGEAGSGTAVAAAGYAMATGALSAAPSTGLADGQTVTVSGTGIMASYEGPLHWIVPTGRWTLAECDAALLGQRDLLGVFTHCGTAVGGPADVPGSTLTQPVEVAASVERILGGTTDCTASAGACVIALGRVEADGSLSLHTTPLTFA